MTQDNSPIIGIDLGTTNSVVAAYLDGQVRVLEENGTSLLPSVVGVAADGKLVIGQPAKNQLAAFPDRTISSVKRRMGEDVKLKMADESHSPQEISAIILRKLRDRAEAALGCPVTRAVITVPAFFDEHQRQATREAGEMAGFTVERIINEPTAASLVYCANETQRRHLIVYDLGGGTFDVSIVRMEQGVVEVLSSKGDTRLGGDDFDQLLARYVADAFQSDHDIDLMADARTRWRLLHACERAKCELSTNGTAHIIEEFIAEKDGKPVSLDLEISRLEYEELIAPLVDRTIACVDQALRDANMSMNSIDDLLLVGGSTRTPLVQQRLRTEFQREPRWAVNPDLAVALGAATQAAMQSGASVGPILVDVATHTLGIEALSGMPYAPKLRFVPIIHRNSPLPACYEEVFGTVTEDQERAQIHVYQGESESLEHDRSIGKFELKGLNQSAGRDGRIIVRFELTLDGTLSVTAREPRSGIAESIAIENAASRLDGEARASANQRLQSLFESSDEISLQREFASTEYNAEDDDESAIPAPHFGGSSKLESLLARARGACADAAPDDAADIQQLIQSIQQAKEQEDLDLLPALEEELEDLLFYVIG